MNTYVVPFYLFFARLLLVTAATLEGINLRALWRSECRKTWHLCSLHPVPLSKRKTHTSRIAYILFFTHGAVVLRAPDLLGLSRLVCTYSIFVDPRPRVTSGFAAEDEISRASCPLPRCSPRTWRKRGERLPVSADTNNRPKRTAKKRSWLRALTSFVSTGSTSHITSSATNLANPP